MRYIFEINNCNRYSHTWDVTLHREFFGVIIFLLGTFLAASLVVSSTTSSDSFSFFGGDGKVIEDG